MSGGEGAWHRFRRILEDQPLPAAIVDLDAVERNVDRIVAQLVAHSAGRDVPIRLATKSVRHLGLTRRILDRGAGRIRGLMVYAPGEAALLAANGHDDLLLAYPVARLPEARRVADVVSRGTVLRCVVDALDQVEVLARAAREIGVTVPVCIDVDASWRPTGRVHLGVRRSPIRSAADALALADGIARADGVRLVGVMAYEAQVAGIRDHNPGSRRLDPVRRLIKARSRPHVAGLRRSVVDALRAAGHAVELVNGGGTGSVASTGADPSVTEVAAGSGFLCPHLFDGYDGLPLEPAAFFALPVVRRSDRGLVTCAGGGYPASGAAGPDRLPIVAYPPGLAALSLEGWGEVQTPLAWTGDGPGPSVGDPVVCRHAKAGELAERFAAYVLVRGDAIEAIEPTYRGMGACFP